MSAAPEAVDDADLTEEPEHGRRHPAIRTAIVLAIVAVTAGLVAGVVAWTRSGPPSPSAADSWHGWTQRFAPPLATFDSDYVKATRDLLRPDRSAAEGDFEQLARDANRINALADSIDPTVNGDIHRVATHIFATTESVLAHWPSIDLARFDAEVGAYSSASRDLTTAILVANQRYRGG
jgi:hypothetical protein